MSHSSVMVGLQIYTRPTFVVLSSKEYENIMQRTNEENNKG